MFTLPSPTKIALGCLAGLWFAASSPAAEIAPVPTEQALATILESKVILRQKGRHLGPGSEYGYTENGHPKTIKRVIEPDRYVGWATMAKTRKGELLVVFSGDRDSHVDPWGKTQLIRSLDQGKTWSEPETITSTPLDDRDAGIIQTKAGTLVVSWFTSTVWADPKRFPGADRYARFAEKITPEIRAQWKGNWIRRSEDNGKTWGPPIRNVGSAPHGPIELADGRLLYIGYAEIDDRKVATVEQSADDGRTWTVIAEIQKPAGETAGLGEPHLVQTKSGKLIALFRYEPKDRQKCFLQQSESDDGGKTWTPVHSTGIWGYPPHAIRLKNDWLLVAYGYRREPFGERATISRDEGKTWETANPIQLIGAPGPDLGYPSSVQLDDGSILTVYYQADKLGQPTHLGSTHWKLKE